MNYNLILDALNQASVFELYRLSAAIHNQLEDPARIAAVKQHLRPGQEVSWFDTTENRMVKATLLRINRTRASVKNLEDGTHWSIPFYQINLDGKDADIMPRQRHPMDRNRLKVGDQVAFKDKQGVEQFGKVSKLNQKTASVIVGAVRWRVTYSLLSPVIDGDFSAHADPLELKSEAQEFPDGFTETQSSQARQGSLLLEATDSPTDRD